MTEWSSQQTDALDKIRQWLADVRAGTAKPVFRLFGYAGTGKSTIAKEIGRMEEERGGYAQYCAYTGKAAVVMIRKGCTNARTIHGLIYRSHDKAREDYDRMVAELEKLDPESNEAADLRIMLEREKESLAEPGFTPKDDPLQLWREVPNEYGEDGETRRVPWKRITLFVVDEVSMVDEFLGKDLLAAGAPVLVLGDPAQLPPVKGAGFFTNANPDALLTEIHRQAAGNPIIDLATRVRRGETALPLGTFGESRICGRDDITATEIMDADQVLVGKNDTRRTVNGWFRKRLGHAGLLPVVGEKLVCLRNDHEKGLLNGSLWTVVAVEDIVDAEWFKLTVDSIDEDGKRVECIAHKYTFFGGEVPPQWERKRANEFDYGYALTVHKSQGSQWNNVVLMDEWFNRDSRKEWLYTGITRAAERVTVVRKG